MSPEERTQLKRHVIIMYISSLISPPMGDSKTTNLPAWEKVLERHYQYCRISFRMEEKDNHVTINLEVY